MKLLDFCSHVFHLTKNERQPENKITYYCLLPETLVSHHLVDSYFGELELVESSIGPWSKLHLIEYFRFLHLRIRCSVEKLQVEVFCASLLKPENGTWRALGFSDAELRSNKVIRGSTAGLRVHAVAVTSLPIICGQVWDRYEQKVVVKVRVLCNRSSPT